MVGHVLLNLDNTNNQGGDDNDDYDDDDEDDDDGDGDEGYNYGANDKAVKLWRWQIDCRESEW